ncbi:hypothetical protein DITRI_Ditri03aG0064800 [Diplodiscus trichospermus]
MYRHILDVFVKKSLVNSLPGCYILERWTIDAKRHNIQDVSGDVIQEDTQISSILMRNSLMMQFLEVAENGSRSKRKYEYLSYSLQRIHEEILAMDHDYEDTETPNTSYPFSDHDANNLVQSNNGISLQDPLHVRSRGRRKSLRGRLIKGMLNYLRNVRLLPKHCSSENFRNVRFLCLVKLKESLDFCIWLKRM